VRSGWLKTVFPRAYWKSDLSLGAKPAGRFRCGEQVEVGRIVRDGEGVELERFDVDEFLRSCPLRRPA
jgi:hypothetical protein